MTNSSEGGGWVRDSVRVSVRIRVRVKVRVRGSNLNGFLPGLRRPDVKANSCEFLNHVPP